MISNFRNFAKTKFAGILVFIMIIPFVFWGMGGMFSSGNTNTIAKINKTNISTQEFIDYLNNSGIPEKTIKENLNQNIIEELLSGLVSSTLLDLEIKDYDLSISQDTLSEMIKKNKNFLDENGNFQRIKYEKFLLENNQSAPQFEQRLKKRELQKNLFEYIGAGTTSPRFLTNKLYNEENTKLLIDFIDLKNFYKKKETFKEEDLKNFIDENQDELKVEYLHFKYVILNPKNLIGVNEFNQSFFDKIDQIEIDIANSLSIENIIKEYDISLINKKNFKSSNEKNEIEKRIFELRNNNFDIFENGDDYVLYKIESVDKRRPDLNDEQTKTEILELIFQKHKFEYNQNLFNKISKNDFDDNDFKSLGKNQIQSVQLNSIKDNKKFEINAIKMLYSMPENSFTLINDENNNIYLAKINKFLNETINNDDKKIQDYINKQNSNMKNTMLRSYDLYLNNKYNVVLNQKTIERVKNFFQ